MHVPEGTFYGWCEVHNSVWADDPDEVIGMCEHAYVLKFVAGVTPEACVHGLAIVTVI